jgi:hypothetical protein
MIGLSISEKARILCCRPGVPVIGGETCAFEAEVVQMSVISIATAAWFLPLEGEIRESGGVGVFFFFIIMRLSRNWRLGVPLFVVWFEEVALTTVPPVEPPVDVASRLSGSSAIFVKGKLWFFSFFFFFFFVLFFGGGNGMVLISVCVCVCMCV